MPISTMSFGTPYGTVEMNGQRQPVPVDDEMLKKIAELSGGKSYSASNLEELKEVFTQPAGADRLRDRPRATPATGWLRLGCSGAGVGGAWRRC